MSKKDKPKGITFRSIFRFSIFLTIVWGLIFILNQQIQNNNGINDPTTYLNESLAGNVLGDVYSGLPENSRNQLENFNQTEIGKFLDNSVKFIQEKLDGFPQKQIKEIKKSIIKNVSDDIIRSIDEN